MKNYRYGLPLILSAAVLMLNASNPVALEGASIKGEVEGPGPAPNEPFGGLHIEHVFIQFCVANGSGPADECVPGKTADITSLITAQAGLRMTARFGQEGESTVFTYETDEVVQDQKTGRFSMDIPESIYDAETGLLNVELLGFTFPNPIEFDGRFVCLDALWSQVFRLEIADDGTPSLRVDGIYSGGNCVSHKQSA